MLCVHGTLCGVMKNLSKFHHWAEKIKKCTANEPKYLNRGKTFHLWH